MSTRRRVLASAVLVSVSAAAAGAPEGHLLIIGGGARGDAVLGKLVELAGGSKARIAVFPMASSVPDETGRAYVEELLRCGAGSAFALNVNREEADSDAALLKMTGVTGVFLSGGDQVRHTRALLGSRLLRRIHELYAAGAVVSGTSAGAAVMSRVMITGEETRPNEDTPFDRLEAGEVVTSEGFAFLPEDVIVDQHFVKRRRNNRLMSLVLEAPGRLGLGVNEGTAIWVRPDGSFEVMGDGPVVVYDAGGARLEREEGGDGLAGADLKVHVLGPGSSFDLQARKVIRLFFRRERRSGGIEIHERGAP
jgi:cyanophycinase